MKPTPVLRLILLASLCVSTVLKAQNQPTYKMKAGDAPDKEIQASAQYQYPAFQKGKILYIGGRVLEGMLNYSLLTGDIFLLKNQKDTLELPDRNMVKVVDIHGTIFYNDKQYGFCELVSGYGDVKLAKKLKLESEPLSGIRKLYFFVDKNDKYLVPGKNTIAQLFPKQTAQLTEYLEEHPVNFTSEEDLDRLLVHAKELSR